jgi:hypothetical protein
MGFYFWIENGWPKKTEGYCGRTRIGRRRWLSGQDAGQ